MPAVSLFALAATFWVSISNLVFEKKITIFLTIVAFYVLFCIGIYFRQKKRAVSFETENASSDVFNDEVEKQLVALEDASQYFGASLRPADMFRLAASRVREIVPHSAAVLVLKEDFERDLKIVGANGLNAREILALEKIPQIGLAGVCLNLQKIKLDEKLLLEKSILPFEALKYLETAIAVPLFENSEKAFGVLVLYGRHTESFDEKSIKILEAVGERLAPLILSSMAFENSLMNALTDSLTHLPNERAFYLILENQIAESQRRREERPLTILSIDLRDFNELNQKFGHLTGDKILTFSGEIIKKQLRKMDFLARAGSDEFLAVLPTANNETANEIIERIERFLQTSPFILERGHKEFIKLNIGAATLFRDGETAEKLLQTARLRKETAKVGKDSNVLWFPKEFVN